MNRHDFQKLAIIRLEEAEALLKQDCYSGAYYLAGYVVECGLKACIARRTREFDFPPEKKTYDKVYSHMISSLLDVSDLKQILENKAKDDKDFEENWTIIKDWKVEKRYELIGQKDAEDLVNAIKDPKHGVLEWLKEHW